MKVSDAIRKLESIVTLVGDIDIAHLSEDHSLGMFKLEYDNHFDIIEVPKEEGSEEYDIVCVYTNLEHGEDKPNLSIVK